MEEEKEEEEEKGEEAMGGDEGEFEWKQKWFVRDIAIRADFMHINLLTISIHWFVFRLIKFLRST